MTNEPNTLAIIRRMLPYLNPALKRVGIYALTNPLKVKTLRISELAVECHVSEATVTRFVKEIGLENFQSFKISMAEIPSESAGALADMKKQVYEDVCQKDSIEEIIQKVAFKNVGTIQDTAKAINPDEIGRAVRAINRANVITLYCVGTSTIAAESAKMRFYRIGKNCIAYNDPAHLAVSSSLPAKGNVAIGISNSGSTLFTVDALEAAKSNGATTICITNYENSPITRHADIKLFTATKESSFFQESVVSKVAQLLMIDILYTCCASKNYKKSIALLEKSAAAIKKALH